MLAVFILRKTKLKMCGLLTPEFAISKLFNYILNQQQEVQFLIEWLSFNMKLKMHFLEMVLTSCMRYCRLFGRMWICLFVRNELICFLSKSEVM